jgi:4-amino-4-deoxy-L-arabinose transferase-like glycosyltransferase
VAFDIFLVILILIGVFYRFNWVNWNQDTDLHPDEYGLTGTLTQLSIPKDLSEYFNTRLSPISPYQKYDENGNPTQNGPDNRMRWGQWPLFIIRGTAEALNNLEKLTPAPASGERWNFTGYGEMRLLGRSLSALADTLSLIMIFLIGARLYGRRVGLLAAALSALAVMQLQQSHFMTVDNFAGFFTTVAMYACVRIAQSSPVTRATPQVEGQVNPYGPAWKALGWYALFGVGFGMALASKVNLAPLGGMILVAVFISVAQVKLRTLDDLRNALSFGLLFLVVGVLASGLVFRLTQPMTFRAKTGDTTLLTLTPNQDWADSMAVAQAESGGEGGGPPGEQWAHRTRVVFAFVNMVMWGMGLALGLACWIGFGAALWQVLRGRNWQKHLLPLLWAGGYFGFMGTRWVMSTRYFLPIYPFMCLLAAWMLLELWRWAQETQPFRPWRRVVAGLAMGVTVLGALAWASAFMQAVYNTPHTRIQAAHWIFQNIAGPFHLTLRDAQGNLVSEPIPAQDGLPITPGAPYMQPFIAPVSGELAQVSLPHVQANGQATLQVVIASNPDGTGVLGETTIPIPLTQSPVKATFKGGAQLTKGSTYYMIASTQGSASIAVFENTVANESWDEGLPMRFEGHDPFGGLYRGLTMESRWADDENKKNMFLDVIGHTDYIIMPSQRSIWSICRIPLTYPMTMDYYRALFNGSLGFDQVAAFSAPIKLGPLQVSDVGGTFAWNRTPPLPLFNHSSLAAEEAFSVYDHPPVWIFKKRADFNIDKVKAILDKTDLTKVINQGPTTAEGDWCPAQ